jgi:hypothetical protein
MNENFLKLFKLSAVISLILSFSIGAIAQQKQIDIKLLATQFLEANEPKLQETKDPVKQFYLLVNLTPAAFSAGDNEKAINYAEELMTVAKKTQSTPGFGSGNLGLATHISNNILGRIAFNNNEIDKAKEYLLASGQVIGKPPTLISFGPNMLLAKNLIEKGEGETAVKYFDLCANFWKMEDGRLGKWKNIVKEGGMPDFGPNLTTSIDSWRFAQ